MTIEKANSSAGPFPWAAILGPLLHASASLSLIALGASVGTFMLVADYYAIGSDGFGIQQIAGLTIGIASILTGASLEVLSGRRSVAETRDFFVVAAQMGLILVAFRLYHVENRAFYDFLMAVILFGFIVHHYLPQTLKPAFFFSLSLLGIYGLFGVATPIAGLWLVLIGLTLIGICHLPFPLWARCMILVAAAAGLATMRAGWIETSWSSLILPVLSSMFIFRCIIYLYDTHNGHGSKNIWQRLSYFFMLPNIVFPFFPVVDYATLDRTYYNEEANRIYQRGAQWILRGLIHLLIYRITNYYLTLTPDQIIDPATFLQFIVTNFALYFRISGMFHIIVGIMLLFGYNLHETHSRFYLSNGFVDFWRRINIYWKDFMQKVFFNPIFIRAKRSGMSVNAAIIFSMLCVFVLTWALHSYQWFWLRGRVLLSVPDIVFWTGLAALLVIQNLREFRANAAPKPDGTQTFVLTQKQFSYLRTACTFLTICFMWAFWTGGDFETWFGILGSSGLFPVLGVESGIATSGDWLITLLSVLVVLTMALIATGFNLGFVDPRPDKPRLTQTHAKPDPSTEFFRIAGSTTAIAGALILFQLPAVSLLGETAETISSDISEMQLNSHQRAMLDRGYYENLTNVSEFNTQLWEVFQTRPHDASEIREMPSTRLRDDYLEFEFLPNTSSSFNGTIYDINRWGMRDKDYALAKPDNVFRVAVLGASRSVGWGVAVDSRFESLLESWLNEKHGQGENKKFEILNFSVDSYLSEQRLMVLEEKVWQFEPDYILYFAGYRDHYPDHFAKMLSAGVELPYAFLRDIAQRVDISEGMTRDDIQNALMPYRYEMVTGVYNRMAKGAREKGVKATWVYLANAHAYRQRDEEGVVRLSAIAKDAGFSVLDFSKMFKDMDTSRMRLNQWDHHHSIEGHHLIAEELYEGLVKLETNGEIDLGLVE